MEVAFGEAGDLAKVWSLCLTSYAARIFPANCELWHLREASTVCGVSCSEIQKSSMHTAKRYKQTPNLSLR